ncbi:MAG TPA: hypothetical protein PKW90_29870, partial [Myxococcota bacterium]|nr:hypothetical protein [Myxococcota bacterium]
MKKKGEDFVSVGPVYKLTISDTKASITREGGDPVRKLPPDVSLTAEHWDRKFPVVENVPKTVEFFLEGPLNAEQLQVERITKGVQIGPRESPAVMADFGRFKMLASRQWRNLILTHASDWLESTNKEALGDGVKEAVPDGSLAWWKSEVEFPAMGSSKHLIGGALPKDGMVQNMNPVTLKWMLELLHIDRLQRISERVAAKVKADEEARKKAGKGKSNDDALEAPDMEGDDRIWPLFQNPVDRKAQKKAAPNSVVDPVGIGFLVREAKVGLGESILVVLADDL